MTKWIFFSSLLQLKFNVFFTHNAEYTFHHLGYQLLLLAALSDDAVWRLSRFIRSAGGVWPAGWMARIGWSGPARPAWLKAAAARFGCRPGRGISWRPPTYSLFGFAEISGSRCWRVFHACLSFCQRLRCSSFDTDVCVCMRCFVISNAAEETAHAVVIPMIRPLSDSHWTGCPLFSTLIFHDFSMIYRHNIYFQVNDIRLMNAYHN